jgi:hypothetical protein
MASERFVVLGLAHARSAWFRDLGHWAISGAVPTVGEVVPYWRSLVETNRAALADRDNADLVFPGQVFTVPDPP